MSCRCLVILLGVLVCVPVSAWAQVDLEAYDALWQEVLGQHEGVAGAGDAATSEQLEATAQADAALIEWVELAIQTREFQALPYEQRQLMLDNRNRAQFLRIRTLITLERCADASLEADALEERPGLDAQLSEAVASLSEAIDECQPGDAPGPPEGAENPEIGDAGGVPGPVLTASVEAPSGETDTLTWVVLGSGAALLAAGFAYDLATADTRDRFTLLQEACNAGCSEEDFATAEALQGDIQTGRLIDGLLYGGAALSVGAGLVLLLTQDRGEPADQLTITPRLGRTLASVEVEWIF